MILKMMRWMITIQISSMIKWSHRLAAQDASLSRSKPEFDSPWDHHMALSSTLARTPAFHAGKPGSTPGSVTRSSSSVGEQDTYNIKAWVQLPSGGDMNQLPRKQQAKGSVTLLYHKAAGVKASRKCVIWLRSSDGQNASLSRWRSWVRNPSESPGVLPPTPTEIICVAICPSSSVGQSAALIRRRS